MHSRLVVAGALAGGLIAATARSAPPVSVVVLAGQSNMVGYGDGTLLPPELASQPDVWYDHFNPAARDGGEYAGATSQGWEPLGPRGSLSHYGPEITLGAGLADELPDRRIAIVKMAMGGTNIPEHWARGLAADPAYPSKSQLYHALFGARDSATYAAPDNPLSYPGEVTRLDHALERLDAAGETWALGCFVWMQGENEAGWSAAFQYGDRLAALVAAVRDDLGAPALPVVVGRISDNLYAKNGGPLSPDQAANIDAVRQAQVDFGENDGHAAWIDTDDLPARPGDPYHFDDDGYRTLGERFAIACAALIGVGGGGGGAGGAGGAGGTDSAGGAAAGGASSGGSPPSRAANSADDGGCGCRAAGSPGSPGGVLVAALVVALGLAARRRERLG